MSGDATDGGGAPAAAAAGALERAILARHARLAPRGTDATDALPAGCVALPAAADVRATDAWALEERGVAGTALMTASGHALADAVHGLAPEGRVVVVCGAGNNGGDGYLAARLLREAGRDVDVVRTVPHERLAGDAAWARDALPGPAAEPWREGCLDGAAIAVDCILGTGTRGAPRDVAADAVADLERAAAGGLPVLACDVPSGVDADTGEAPGPAVRAQATVALHAATPGLLVHPGRARAGELLVADIGIPPGGPASQGARAGLLAAGVASGLPRRDAASTKFSSGFVLLVAGSPSMTGAAVLAARGAQRGGAGYVQVAVPAEGEAGLVARLPPDVTTLALREEGDAAAARLVDRAADRRATLVVGPGLGREAAVRERVLALADGVEGPLVLDADGLAALGDAPDRLAGRTGATVLTPHEGEASRLLGARVDEVRARRRHAAEELARRSRAVVVFKGDDTLVVGPDGRTLISPGGVPELATAGTGDVLAGLVGALLARGLGPLRAAAAAVRLHLAAGALVSAEHGEGTTAADVAEALGRAELALRG